MRHFLNLPKAMALSAGFTFAQPILAYVEPVRTDLAKSMAAETEEGMKVLRPKLIEDNSFTVNKFGKKAAVSRDKINGTVRLISGQFGQVRLDLAKSVGIESAFVEAAEKFMNDHPDEFLAEGLVYRLNKDALHISEKEQFVSFDVERNGSLVWDAHVDFRFKLGQLVQVQNFSFVDAAYDVSEAKLSRADLRRNLRNQLGFRGKFKRNVVRIIESENDYRAEPMAEFAVTANGEDFLAQVSYLDGAVFQYFRTNQYGSGTAGSMIYQRSWFEEEAVPMPFVQLNVSIPALPAVQTNLEGAFTFTGNAVPTMPSASGAKVKVTPSSGATLKLTGVKEEGTEDSYKLFFAPLPETDKKSDKLMAQSMVYVHINRIIARASQFVTPTWFDKPLPANTSLNSSCNAYWNGTSVNFYAASTKCANTALSSDIVFHEWGHGLDANTGGMADGAFSEGYGDIMSLVMNNSPDLGTGFYVTGKGIRELRTKKIYPRDRGEVHAEGLIIASTFYDVLVALTEKYGEAEARETLAKYAFKVIYTARRYTDVYKALLVIDDNDADLSNLTPNLCLLNTAFTAHGLATKDTRCTVN